MIIGLSGKAKAGKSTIALFLKEKGFAEESFAAPIRAFVAELLGLTLAQLELVKESPSERLGGHTPRYAMQTLGTEWGRHMNRNLWVEACLDRARKGNTVISDVRFENESDAIRNMGGVIWHIQRPGAVTTALSNHPSEQGIVVQASDEIIINDGSLEQLKEKMEKLLLLQ